MRACVRACVCLSKRPFGMEVGRGGGESTFWWTHTLHDDWEGGPFQLVPVVCALPFCQEPEEARGGGLRRVHGLILRLLLLLLLLSHILCPRVHLNVCCALDAAELEQGVGDV